MLVNKSKLEIINAEISASTVTQNKESMSEETFRLPTSQKAQNQYDNIGAYNQLQAMMSFKGLMNYLISGEVADFDTSPMEVQPLKEETNYALLVLKLMLEEHWGIQFTPLFRERSNYITAQKVLRKGTIYFRIPRTDENVELLRDYDVTI